VTVACTEPVRMVCMWQMDLRKFENKTAGSLSGGNKRKLSVAIAMIGDPPIVFLGRTSLRAVIFRIPFGIQVHGLSVSQTNPAREWTQWHDVSCGMSSRALSPKTSSAPSF
jgi:hypothetical protein